VAKQKYDGVVQAVHYKPDGQVDWVRAYLRRGPTFSDHVLLDRQTLLEQIKAGKRFWVGQRVPQLAGTFEVTEALHVVTKDGKEALVVGEESAERDHLKGVPVI